MTDRPILFSGPMVRALLDGRKTQTRRVFKGIERLDSGSWHIFGNGGGAFEVREEFVPRFAPDYARYQIGDRLWVREAIAYMPRTAYALPKTVNPNDPDMAAYYRADFDRSGKPGWKPGIHMPRWASRLTLTVTDVRVQRLQDINEADARAEGVLWVPGHGEITPADLHEGYSNYLNFREGFQVLWNSINGPRGYGWEANPWVVVISFTIQRGNIDQVRS